MPGGNSQRWTWLDAGLLPLAGAAMRAAWIAPPLNGILRFMTGDEAVGGAGLVAFALLIGSAYTAFLARRFQGSRWIVAGGGLLAVVVAQWWLLDRGLYPAWDVRWLARLAGELTSWPAAIPRWVVLIAATAIWWRGMTADWTSHAELAGSFVVGVVVLAICLAPLPAWSPRSAAELPGAIGVFLASAWAGLALAEVSTASHEARREAASIGLNRYWLLAVLAVVVGIFGLGLAAAGLVTPESVATLLAALRPVWAALGWALLVVLTGLAYVMFLVLMPLRWLLTRFAGAHAPPLPQLFEVPPPNAPGATAPLPPALVWLLRGGLIVGLAVVIGLLFAWALRRYYSRDEDGVQETRELIWSWDLIRAQLASLLARLGRESPPQLFGPLPPKDLRAAVRAAYRQVLQSAVANGQPRRPGQTPAGYLPTLQAIWPEEAEALRLLTDLYTEARYNPAPPSAEQATQAHNSAERIVRLPGMPANGKATAGKGTPGTQSSPAHGA